MESCLFEQGCDRDRELPTAVSFGKGKIEMQTAAITGSASDVFHQADAFEGSSDATYGKSVAVGMIKTVSVNIDETVLSFSTEAYTVERSALANESIAERVT